MGKYNKLGVNIITFLIGNMGSRLIQFLFIPLYTYWLTTYEYGIIDTVMITVYLCTPFASLSIHDALLRYMLDKDSNRSKIYTISCIIGTIGSLLFLSSILVFKHIEILKPYWIYFYVYMVISVFFNIQLAYIRGLEQNKLYSALGIISTLLQAIGIVLFVGYFHYSIKGYLLAMIISYGLTLFLSIFITRSWRYFSITEINKTDIKNMLAYSIPLVPNAIMWWIINSSDKYLILYYLSAEENGLFAISTKIPMIINIVYQIFLMAWQISVIEEHNKEGKEHFYHKIYTLIISGLFLSASFIMIFIKPAVNTFLSTAYNEVWYYIPILLISTIFACLAGFYGSFYVAFKRTKGVLKTSIVCAVINVTFNLLSIRYCGLWGVSLASFLSFFILYIYRIYDTRKMVSIPSEKKLVFSNLIIVFIQILTIYLVNNYLSIILLSILFVAAIIINRNIIKETTIMVKQLIHKNNHEKSTI